MSLVMSVEQRKERIALRVAKEKSHGVQQSQQLSLGFTNEESQNLTQLFITLLDANHIKYYDFFAQSPAGLQSFFKSVSKGII